LLLKERIRLNGLTTHAEVRTVTIVGKDGVADAAGDLAGEGARSELCHETDPPILRTLYGGMKGLARARAKHVLYTFNFKIAEVVERPNLAIANKYGTYPV